MGLLDGIQTCQAVQQEGGAHVEELVVKYCGDLSLDLSHLSQNVQQAYLACQSAIQAYTLGWPCKLIGLKSLVSHPILGPTITVLGLGFLFRQGFVMVRHLADPLDSNHVFKSLVKKIVCVAAGAGLMAIACEVGGFPAVVGGAIPMLWEAASARGLGSEEAKAIVRAVIHAFSESQGTFANHLAAALRQEATQEAKGGSSADS